VQYDKEIVIHYSSSGPVSQCAMLWFLDAIFYQSISAGRTKNTAYLAYSVTATENLGIASDLGEYRDDGTLT